MTNQFHMIAAVTPGNGIGCKGKLLVFNPVDMAWFHNITIGHTVVMGRKTFMSIERRALVERNIVVLSRSMEPRNYPNIKVFNSLYMFMQEYQSISNECYIIGGGIIYQEMMPFAKYLHLTMFPDYNPGITAPDAYFPTLDNTWTKTMGVDFIAEVDALPTRIQFNTYVRD